MSRCVVELAGPAGAGKTTLAAALEAQCAGTLLEVDTGRLRVGAGLARAAPALLSGRFSTPGRPWTTEELRSIVYLTSRRGPVAHGSGHGLVLLDHGPVFRLAMLAAHGPPAARGPVFHRWWRRTALEWGHLLDAVVCLDASDEVLRARIDSRRRYHRVQGARRDEVEAFLARYRGSYAQVLDLVSEAGACVLHLDTSTGTPEQLARIVSSRLGRSDAGALP